MYIVYEGEFETDKPREYMAEPSILLVTTDEQAMMNMIYEKFNWYKEHRGEDYTIEKCSDGFTFTDHSYIYGKVGYIER